MQAKVVKELDDVQMVLDRLGVPLQVLQEAVQAGYVSRISCTTNDAPSASGFYQWNGTLRNLREKMVSAGWQRNNTSNWPTIVHPEKLLAIAVSSGNENTGRVNGVLSTKNAKGIRTVTAVSINANQLWLPGFEFMQLEQGAQISYPTWFLLFYADEKELRAELSLPVKVDSEGRVNSWRERIILPVLSLEPEIKISEPDFGPDVDIKITRRG